MIFIQKNYTGQFETALSTGLTNVNNSWWIDSMSQGAERDRTTKLSIFAGVLLTLAVIGLLVHAIFLLFSFLKGIHILSKYQHIFICVILLSVLDSMQLVYGIFDALAIIHQSWDYGAPFCYLAFIFQAMSRALPPIVLIIMCYEQWGILGKAFGRASPESRTFFPICLFSLMAILYESDVFFRYIHIVEDPTKDEQHGRMICALGVDNDRRVLQTWITLIFYFLAPLFILVFVDCCLKQLPRRLLREDPLSRALLIVCAIRWTSWLPVWTYEILLEVGQIGAGDVVSWMCVTGICFIPPAICNQALYALLGYRMMRKEAMSLAGSDYFELGSNLSGSSNASHRYSTRGIGHQIL